MKTMMIFASILLSSLTSKAQLIQSAEINFHAADEFGATASVSGPLADVLYSRLNSEELLAFQNDGKKSWKNGQDYYCVKSLNTFIPDTECFLHFPKITFIPHEEFKISIRFDIEGSTLNGYSLNPEIDQIMYWDLSSGRIIN
ncbi:hypothetical protein ACLVWU_12925 [Bdellovibrio sp. HCB290]|uniref:hypothetical protein n=1 Tax=Bdellovibrio sp. HCB290 TaxID=3394356 RepID=UPI0039B6AF55